MTCFITTATYKNVINWPRYIGTWLLPLSTSDYSGKVGLNLALGLVTSCYSRKTVFGRPVYCWLRWGYTMSIGDPYEATRVLMDGLKRSSHGMGQLTKGLTNDCFKTRCICCCFKIKCCILSLVLLFHLSLSLSLLIEKQVFHFDTRANQICAQTSATLLIGLEGDRYLSLSLDLVIFVFLHIRIVIILTEVVLFWVHLRMWETFAFVKACLRWRLTKYKHPTGSYPGLTDLLC